MLVPLRVPLLVLPRLKHSPGTRGKANMYQGRRLVVSNTPKTLARMIYTYTKFSILAVQWG